MTGTRRAFLTKIATVGGTGAMYTAMRALGLVDDGVAHAATPQIAPGSGSGASVVVLGAGLAGLTAAYELRKAGYAVTILEARDRVGGRSFTVRRGTKVQHEHLPDQTCGFDEGEYFNAGPGRIPSHHQATLGYCRELGVEMEVLVNHSTSTLLQAESLNGGQPLPMREAVYGVRGHVASLLAKGVQNGGVDIGMTADDGERLVAMLRGWGGLDPDLAFTHSDRLGFITEPSAGAELGRTREAMTLAALMQPAAWGWPAFTDALDMQSTMLQPVGGMDRIPHAFAERLGDAIVLNAEVKRMRRRGDGVRIEWRDRATGTTRATDADWCVCTVPFPVLKDVDTDLPAPRKSVITGADNGDAYKIAFQSPRFWEAENQIYGGLSFTDRDTFMTWYPSGGFHRPKGILVAGYSFGGGAVGMGARDLTAQEAYARETVERLHPGHGKDLTAPVAIHWKDVPFSRGIASRLAESDPDGYLLMNEPEGPYVFAGEHLSHVGAWQQGAFVSAWQAVNQIASRRQSQAA